MGMHVFYYTDPLSAAWMCQEHGIVYEDANGEPYGTPSMVLMQYNQPRPQRHLIRALSHDALAPKVGDLVTNTFGGNKGRECSGLVEGFMNDGTSAVITTCERHNGKRYFVESVVQLVIVQRDGKPFFRPECEEQRN